MVPSDLYRSLSDDQRRANICGARFVAAPPPVLFEFLSHLDNHWALVAGYGERVGSGDARGSTIRLRGPRGLRRTVGTRVLDSQPPRSVVGTAAVGSRTRAIVRWSIRTMDAGSWVELTASVHRASGVDQALLMLGAGRWLQRGFETALARLAETHARSRRPASGKDQL